MNHLEGLFKHVSLSLTLTESDSVDLGWRSQICTSQNFSGNGDAAGLLANLVNSK